MVVGGGVVFAAESSESESEESTSVASRRLKRTDVSWARPSTTTPPAWFVTFAMAALLSFSALLAASSGFATDVLCV